VVIKSGDIFFYWKTISELRGTSKLCNICNAVVLPPVKKGCGKNSHLGRVRELQPLASLPLCGIPPRRICLWTLLTIFYYLTS